MLTTGLALLLAHLLADYPFQTNMMVRDKAKPHIMALHIAVVFVTALIALRFTVIPAITLVLIHLAIDLIKTYALPKTLWSYLTDQAAHLASIAAVLWYWPDLALIWPASDPIVQYLLATACGLLLSVWAGGPAIGYLMAGFEEAKGDGLPEAGRMIGMLERALIFVMVLASQTAGIGFLIAAKSVLRFDTASKDQKAGEYVIIGTLASFGWALAISFATLKLITIANLAPATP